MSSDIGIRIRGLKEVEAPDGSLIETIETWHPLEMFHPLPNDEEPTFDIGVKIDDPDNPGTRVDMSKLFAPIALGEKITTGATGIGTVFPDGHAQAGQLVDAEDMYARMGSIPIPLELTKIPKGDFSCETYLFTYMDTSGSMNSVLPAARAAVAEMRKYFKGIFYPGPNGDTLAAQYIRGHVDVGNEAWINWFAGSSIGSQSPHNCVSIAFINESQSIYHPGHPKSTFISHANGFKANYDQWIAGGGRHHSAVMGLAGGRQQTAFSYHVLDAINNMGLKDYNVQGFMGLDAGGGSPYFVGLMVDWLNIPQTPADLTPSVEAVDDQVHQTTVTWDVRDIICGKTGTYDAAATDRIAYTMQGWQLQVATDSQGTNVVQTTATTDMRPTTHTFTESAKRGAKYWLRLRALGAAGNADKNSSWTLCRMKNSPPVITVTGDNPATVPKSGSYADPGWSATDDHDEESALTKTVSYPNGFNANDMSQTALGDYTITYTATDTSGASSTATRTVTVGGQLLTSTSGYVGFTDLGWDYTQDLQGGTEGNTDYVYEISTGGPGVAAFEAGITQTITETSFVSDKIFAGLDPYTTYYSRVRATGDLPGDGIISSNHSDPCSNFTASRTDNGDGTVTITVQTHTPNTGVFIIEEMAGDIRGLVRPVADDQFGKLFIASGEGVVQTTTAGAGGKLVFDGGFPKFYDDGWRDSYKDDMYGTGTPGQWPYMVNVMKYCSSSRTTRTNKLCYINDAETGGYSYPIFDGGIIGCADYLGWTVEGLSGQTNQHSTIMKTTTDSAATWKAYFDDFDMVIFLGATHMDDITIKSNFINGLLDYFDDGGGLFVITDHDVYQHQVNQIVERYGVEFKSLINRTTGNDAYKVETILDNTAYIPQGVHPLFADIPETSYIHAGNSEGELAYKTSGTNWGKTSSYTSNASGQLTITTHNDDSDVGTNKIILRTANDCGQIFEAI